MRVNHRLLKLVLLAGLALPAAALATDPLNMPPSANDPLNSAAPPPKSSAAEAARAAQVSVVTSGSVMENARREVAASREESRRNLDAGVRGQTPPVRTTGTQQAPSQAAVRETAERMGVLDGLDAGERAAVERAIADMPIFETAEDETQRAIDEMSVFGEECEDPDFSSEKARVRAGLVQGQQYGQQNEAGLRATAQATGIQAYADLADKLEKQRLAYSNIDERVEGVGGTNGCKPEAESKPKPKPKKTPGAKGPKAPKPPATQGPKTPSGSGSPPSEPQSSPQQGEVKSVFHDLLVQAEEVEDSLADAKARYAVIEQREREARARGEDPPLRSFEDEQLRRDIGYMQSQLDALNRQMQNEIDTRGAGKTPTTGDIRDRMQPGLTPDERQSLPQHQPNDTRTTEQLQRDLHDTRADAQRLRREAKEHYDEVLRREQDARARGEDAPPRSAADEQARRDLEYHEARIIDADRQLNAIATDTTSPRALQDREAAVQRRLDEAVRLRENIAREREAAVARGENPPVTARDRDLAREVETMRGELEDLDEQLSETNPGRPRPITDPKTGATMRTPLPAPKP